MIHERDLSPEPRVDAQSPYSDTCLTSQVSAFLSDGRKIMSHRGIACCRSYDPLVVERGWEIAAPQAPIPNCSYALMNPSRSALT